MLLICFDWFLSKCKKHGIKREKAVYEIIGPPEKNTRPVLRGGPGAIEVSVDVSQAPLVESGCLLVLPHLVDNILFVCFLLSL